MTVLLHVTRLLSLRLHVPARESGLLDSRYIFDTVSSIFCKDRALMKHDSQGKHDVQLVEKMMPPNHGRSFCPSASPKARPNQKSKVRARP